MRGHIEHIFTVHARKRFCERVLQLSKKINLDIYEQQNRYSLNLELKKRLAGAVKMEQEIDTKLLATLKHEHGDKKFIFFVNGKVIFVGVEDNSNSLPVIVTCYKTDGYIGWYLKNSIT